MVHRQPLSKTTRFEVLKRDGFLCQYCGAHPPAAILEIDHIIAVSAGGLDDESNLVTACFDCNRGKGARDLSICPETIAEKSRILKEKEEQLAGYKKLLKAKRRRENRQIKSIEETFSTEFEGCVFTTSFEESIRRNFLPNLDPDELETAIGIACDKFSDQDSAISYFCGICWRMIRDKP